MVSYCHDIEKQVRKTHKNSEQKFRELVNFFALNLEASQIAELTGLNCNTINRFLRAIRERLAEFCEPQSPFSGEVEVNELFFGARIITGKRGRGAYGKTIVFGALKRDEKVYTEIVLDCSTATLQGIIGDKVEPESMIYSDRGVVTTAWLMLDTASIFESIMTAMSLLGANRITTAQKASGVLQNRDSRGSGELAKPPSTCTSKNVSLDSIIVTRIFTG